MFTFLRRLALRQITLQRLRAPLQFSYPCPKCQGQPAIRRCLHCGGHGVLRITLT